MPAECHDDRLVLDRQNRRSWLSGAGRQVGNRATLPPLRHRLRVDAVAPAKDPQALLTMLYRSTDCLCRGGAAVQNLAHSASLHSREKSAPSKPGIKHLVMLAFISLAARGVPDHLAKAGWPVRQSRTVSIASARRCVKA